MEDVEDASDMDVDIVPPVPPAQEAPEPSTDVAPEAVRPLTAAATRPQRAVPLVDYAPSSNKRQCTEELLLLAAAAEDGATLLYMQCFPAVTNTTAAEAAQPDDRSSVMVVGEDPATPTSFKKAMNSPDAPLWQQAMDTEFQGLEARSTWAPASLPPGVKALRTKWVYKLKKNASGQVIKWKARLVVMGNFQVAGRDFTEVFAPVCSPQAFRTMIAAAARQNWHVYQIDFVQAYLNSILHEDIYIHAPEGCPAGTPHILMLNKALYGLKQAGKEWFDTLSTALLGLGYTQSDADPAAFCRGDVHLLLYVDDKLVMGPDKAHIQQAIDEIGTQFEITDMGPASYYLGVDIIRRDGSITLSQKGYTTQLLQKYGVPPFGRSCPTPAVVRSAQEQAASGQAGQVPYSEAVGALLYLAQWTRPDIAMAVGQLTRQIKAPRITDWEDVNRVLKYLSGTVNQGITYTSSGGELHGYCDSDYAGCVATRRSISGYVFVLSGGPICWKSKQQPTVALSTCEAELMAANLAAREALWLRKFLPELGIPLAGPVPIWEDNKGTLELLKHQVLSPKSKHIDVCWKFARERVERGELLYSYLASEDNLADLFTKPLLPVPFQKFKNLLVS
jgi:hypothetical protein